MKLCAVAGAGAGGLGLLSLLALCHTGLTLPSRNSHPVPSEMPLGSQNICRHVFGNERLCPAVQGAVAEQDPQRSLKGCWALFSGG